MLTIDVLRRLYPQAAPSLLAAVAASSGPVMERFRLTGRRLVYFLAQVGHESAGMTRLVENLNYSAERLMQVWPSRFQTLSAARLYARQPERLANFVYADRMGNGDAASGDGWRFRGRGLIQITGRETYGAVGIDAGLSLIDRPELASDPATLLHVAAAYWKWKGLNRYCDDGNFRALTRAINGGLNGWADRLEWLEKTNLVFGD